LGPVDSVGEAFGTCEGPRVRSFKGALVRVFINMRTIDEALFALLEKSCRTLWSKPRLLFQELLLSRRVVRAARRDITTIAEG